MCGIAGYLNLDGAPAARAVCAAMARSLAHRGPDGEGVYCAGPLALGHRRLAVIDLSVAAAQPMHSHDRRYTVIYNGELYNFRELRAELEDAGHRFRTRSDTEVLIAAWAEWGADALPRFNGMFAFALWDASERSLHLARDRYGIKPLYWARHRETVLFGSEIKALLAYPGFDARLDAAGLVEYLSFQNFFGARTLFADAEMLPPGSHVVVRDGRVGTPRVYWDWSFAEPDGGGGVAEYTEELDRLMQQAVRRQLVSDVPVGAYLSGGMDSASITAMAAAVNPGMCTFTVGFDTRSASGLELAFDERETAEYMSYVCGTEHYEMVLKAGDMQRALPRMAPHIEEPRVGQSYPNFYASQLASKFGKVVLAGAGGDEIFGGYPWRYYRAVVNDDFEHYVDKYFAYWQRLVPDDDFAALVRPLGSASGHAAPRELFRGVFPADMDAPHSAEDYVNHSLYFEARTFLHGLLVVEDKLAMAHGLEVRVPFLDNDLVDFAMRVPVRHKLGNLGEVVRLNENSPGPKTEMYYRDASDGKLLLRQAMARHVPDDIVNGPKRGFSGPDASWFRGESIDFVKATLLSDDCWLWSVLDRSVGQRLLEDHLEGRANRRLLVWSLLSLNQWAAHFLGAGQAAQPTALAARS